jgi:CBS domain containing-hemolysin-like protein
VLDAVVITVVSLALVLVTGFYVLAEFAAVRARRTRIEQLAEEGSAAARWLGPVTQDPRRLDRFVATCQIGITITSLLLGFYGQRALAPKLADWLGGLLGPATALALAATLALLIMSALQIVLGELVPKAIAVRYPERSAILSVGPMRLSERLFGPLVWAFNGAALGLLRLLRVPPAVGHGHLHSPEEIELLVAESGGAGALDPVERRMLHNAFDLGQLVARQVMIPRNRVELAAVSEPAEVLLRQLAASPYSRLPVYEGTPDNVLGIVHLKDLLRLRVAGTGRVADVVRPVPVVPETMPVVDLWQVLSQRHTYLALVIDEYGGTAGIVTQEDLLEEVFGEVQDEFDAEAEPIAWLADGRVAVRGDVLVEHANSSLGLELPEAGADTMGGLVFETLDRLPEVGDRVKIAGAELAVAAIRGRSIERLVLRLPRRPAAPAEDD